MGGVFSGGCGTGGTAEKQLGLVVLRSCGGHRDEQGRDFFELQIGRGRPRSPLFAIVFQLKLGGVGGEKVAGEEKMIGEVLGLFEGFEDLADDFVLELVALDFQLG